MTVTGIGGIVSERIVVIRFIGSDELNFAPL